jgi:hypothetical protein
MKFEISDTEPTIAVSMARKINMGNFESADCFVSLSGIKAGMTPEEMAPLLDTGKVAWDLVRAALAEQVQMSRPA